MEKRGSDQELPERPQDRKDNLATWSVIIGACLCVALFFGSAYSRQSLAGLFVGIVTVVYLIVLSIPGHINIVRVLWGETIDEDKPEVNSRLIVLATVAVGGIAIAVFVYNLLSGNPWGWFSWAGGLIALGYLVLILRNPDQKGEMK